MTDTATEPRVVTVTPMQRAVIGHLADDGATDPEIGKRLGVSHWTVKTHLRKALARVGSPNRTALVCDLLRGRVVLKVEDQRGSHMRKGEPA